LSREEMEILTTEVKEFKLSVEKESSGLVSFQAFMKVQTVMQRIQSRMCRLSQDAHNARRREFLRKGDNEGYRRECGEFYRLAQGKA
jgi:hypothetical protein